MGGSAIRSIRLPTWGAPSARRTREFAVRRTFLPSLVIVAGCIAAGGLVVQAPLLIFMVVGLAAVCALAALYPIQTLWACVIASALHGELFFKLRATTFGVPLSLFDLTPTLLLIAAIALRVRRRGERPETALLSLVFWLSLTGLAIGVLIGLAQGAEYYQIGRVVRIEVALLLVLLAAVVAGRIPEWHRALGVSLYVAGVLMAIEIWVSFAWLNLTGGSVWAIFGLVEPTEVSGAISEGSGIALRDLALNPYVMIPAFCLAAIRLRRADIFTIGLVVSAALISLSRGAWFAVVVATITTVAFHLVGSRPHATAVLRAGVPIALATLAAISLGGDALSNRLDRTLSPEDASAGFREAETKDVLRLLTEDPGAFVFGLGAGTVIEHSGLSATTKREPSPLLENNVLSKWTNTSMLSLAATVILLFAAFGRGWRVTRIKGSPAFYAMGLSLPALALSGLFGGTLNWVPFSGPLWLLAATILGSDSRLSQRTSARRA